jgi:Family of unknown function (DUF6221)
MLARYAARSWDTYCVRVERYGLLRRRWSVRYERREQRLQRWNADAGLRRIDAEPTLREGICGNVMPDLFAIGTMTAVGPAAVGVNSCVLSYGHRSDWHEDENGARWKLAQLDEDERVANAVDEAVAASGGSWDATTDRVWGPFGQHIGRHRSARILAEVAAKRAILDEVALKLLGEEAWARRFGLHLLRLLASAYVDHPGYDETWRP